MICVRCKELKPDVDEVTGLCLDCCIEVKRGFK